MKPSHLSDEAVAAFADGVLTGHARLRATRHTAECPECAQAVREQREATFALRIADAPPLPSALIDRLRSVPQNTPITVTPTVLADDGSPLLPTFAPMAALVPAQAPPRQVAGRRGHPVLATTAAAAVLAGAIATGVMISDSSSEPAPPQQKQAPFTTMFTNVRP